MNIPAEHEDKVKIIIGFLSFFIPVILYAVQIPFYQNCLDLPRWLLIYAMAGGLIGGAIGFYIIREREGDFHRFQIVMAGLILGILLMPLIATLLNRGTAFMNAHQQKVEVVSVRSFEQSRFGKLDGNTKPDGFYIYVLYDGAVIRLQAPSKEDLQSIKEGDQTHILVSKGLLGLSWATLVFSENSI